MRAPPADAAEGHAPLNDCWNRIGVRGDASCPELKIYAHCRNCPVFSSAALTLLDRETPPDYLAEWTAHFAEPKKAEEPDTHTAILFRIGEDWLALPTLIFDEVAELRAIHSLPHRRSEGVLGLVNVRGELIICVSLEKMLGLTGTAPDAEPSRARRLVVIRSRTGRMAFPVDEVRSTHRFHPREMNAVPATMAKAAANHTRAILQWREKKVGYLDDQLVVQTLDRSVA